jgi:hypothetical protein
LITATNPDELTIPFLTGVNVEWLQSEKFKDLTGEEVMVAVFGNKTALILL